MNVWNDGQSHGSMYGSLLQFSGTAKRLLQYRPLIYGALICTYMVLNMKPLFSRAFQEWLPNAAVDDYWGLDTGYKVLLPNREAATH